MPEPTRRALLLAGAAAFVLAAAMPAYAWSPFNRGGHPRPQLGGGALLHTFTAQEVNGAASKGLLQGGLPIPPNTVMPGTVLELRQSDGVTVVPAQFDMRSSFRYTNEGLKFCSVFLADPNNFTANEQRTYKVYTKSGTWNNTPATTLAAALAGHDYQVYFTGIVSLTNGALAPITVAFNPSTVLASRTIQYQSGPYINSWEVWVESTHPQLIVTFYYSQIRDSSGAFVSDEIVVEPGMFWWDVGPKETLTYTAELRDGGVSLATYTNVYHNPHACWYMVRTQNDNQHGLPIWNGAPRPTLIYQPDQAAWKNSGLVPRYDTTLSYIPVVKNTYIPGNQIGHRYAISGASAFMGEGVLPNSDIIAFAHPTAANIRTMVVNAMVGGHVPLFHCRSAEIVTKPGKTADKANTICPQIMYDGRSAATPLSYYDYRADGMPTPKDYYTRPSFETSGFVVPPNPSFLTQPDGTWEYVADAAHAINYSYGTYLWTAYRHYLRALIDYGVAGVTEQAPTEFTGTPPMEFWNNSTSPLGPVYPGAVSPPWRAIGCRSSTAGTTRMMGRGHLMMSCVTIIPDGEVETNYLDKFYSHQALYTKASYDVLPVEANGIWTPSVLSTSGFMHVYCTLGLYHAYDLTRLPYIKDMAEYLAKVQIQFAASGLIGQASSFHFKSYKRRDIHIFPNPITNPFIDPPDPWWNVSQFGHLTGGTVDTGVVISFPWANGDTVVFPTYNDTNGADQTPLMPPEITADTIYYVVGASGSNTSSCQFSATPGGAPIITSANNAALSVEFQRQNAADPAKWVGAKNSADYGMGQRAAFLAARHHAHPLATSAYRDMYQAMYGAFPLSDYPWRAYELV